MRDSRINQDCLPIQPQEAQISLFSTTTVWCIAAWYVVCYVVLWCGVGFVLRANRGTDPEISRATLSVLSSRSYRRREAHSEYASNNTRGDTLRYQVTHLYTTAFSNVCDAYADNGIFCRGGLIDRRISSIYVSVGRVCSKRHNSQLHRRRCRCRHRLHRHRRCCRPFRLSALELLERKPIHFSF